MIDWSRFGSYRHDALSITIKARWQPRHGVDPSAPGADKRVDHLGNVSTTSFFLNVQGPLNVSGVGIVNHISHRVVGPLHVGPLHVRGVGIINHISHRVSPIVFNWGADDSTTLLNEVRRMIDQHQWRKVLQKSTAEKYKPKYRQAGGHTQVIRYGCGSTKHLAHACGRAGGQVVAASARTSAASTATDQRARSHTHSTTREVLRSSSVLPVSNIHDVNRHSSCGKCGNPRKWMLMKNKARHLRSQGHRKNEVDRELHSSLAAVAAARAHENQRRRWRSTWRAASKRSW